MAEAQALQNGGNGFNTLHEAVVFREGFDEMYDMVNNMNEEQANRLMCVVDINGNDATRQGETSILHLLVNGVFQYGDEGYIELAKMLFNRFQMDTELENSEDEVCAWVLANSCIDSLEMEFPDLSDDDLQNREVQLNRLIALIEQYQAMRG
jgi:hypothetical protein